MKVKKTKLTFEEIMRDKKDDLKMVVLPIYDIYTDEWLIQLEDASFKRISHEEYKKLYVFKTRYDVGR